MLDYIGIPRVELVSLLFVVLLNGFRMCLTGILELIAMSKAQFTVLELLRAPTPVSITEIVGFWDFNLGKKLYLLIGIISSVLLRNSGPAVWTAVKPQNDFSRKVLDHVTAGGCATDMFDYQFRPYGDGTVCSTVGGCDVLKAMFSHLTTQPSYSGKMVADMQILLSENNTDFATSPSTTYTSLLNPILQSAYSNEPCKLQDVSACSYITAKDWYGQRLLNLAPVTLGNRNPGFNRVKGDLKLLDFVASEDNSKLTALWKYTGTGVDAAGMMSMRKLLFRTGSLVNGQNPTSFTGATKVLWNLLQGVDYVNSSDVCSYEPQKRKTIQATWTDGAETWSAMCTKNLVFHYRQYNDAVCFVTRSVGFLLSGTEGRNQQDDDATYSWTAQYAPGDAHINLADMKDLALMFSVWDAADQFSMNMLQTYVQSCEGKRFSVSGIVGKTKYLVPTWLVAIGAAALLLMLASYLWQFKYAKDFRRTTTRAIALMTEGVLGGKVKVPEYFLMIDHMEKLILTNQTGGSGSGRPEGGGNNNGGSSLRNVNSRRSTSSSIIV